MKFISSVLALILLLACCVRAEEAPATAAVPEQSAAPQTEKLVALTFDDGPDIIRTAPTLDVLEKYGVRATFFLQGNKINAESAPLVERALALGSEIGCHGWDHRIMTKVSLEMTQKQVRQFFGALEEYVHVPLSVKLVRPPGGHSSAKVRLAAEGVGLAVILWDVDSGDWKIHDKDKIAAGVLSKVKDGSIILMHDRHQPTVDAIEIIIPALLEQGYTFVTVSELLTRNGAPIEAGVEYMRMDKAEIAEAAVPAFPSV